MRAERELGRDRLRIVGTSDPYVRCVQGQERLFQTRHVPKSVNPVWGETFTAYTDNPFRKIEFQGRKASVALLL